MKHTILLASLAVLSFSADAEPSATDVQFVQNSPLSAVIEAIPGSTTDYPWLDGIIAKHYSGPIDDNTMANTRELFERWCKAQQASILQPRQHNCAPLSGGYLGCAVGELLRFTASDIEAGLVQLAKKNSAKIQVGWQYASWIISNNLVGTLFFKSKEKSIVGELQRCTRGNGSVVAAMIFVSIDNNDDLLFMTGDRLSAVSAVGRTWNLEMAEKKRQADEQKVAARRTAIEGLKPGDAVVSKRESWKAGMIIEMKLPLAQVQWKGRYGGNAMTEWVKLDDLDLPALR